MNDLPHDDNSPFEINGIQFANMDEYQQRLKEDARQLAALIYDIYMEKKYNIDDAALTED